MDITIIIPVYNAEKYLDRCLKSVLGALGKIQGEVILVDNGSQDNSLSVCKKYQTKHKGVISVLQCHTPGASATRNAGVKKAKGKYLWFIDADDYIMPDAIKKLVDEADKTGADIVMMGATREWADGSTSDLPAIDSAERNYKGHFVRYGMGPWQVIVRRSWWLEHGFSFKEGIIHEDMELMSALILYTDKYAFVKEPLYYYCNNEGSVLHKEEFSPHIFDIFPALEGLYQRFTEAGAAEKYHDELEWFFIWNLLIDSAADFAKFPEGRPGFKQSREMLKAYFPNWRKNRFLRQKPLKLRVKIRVNYYK